MFSIKPLLILHAICGFAICALSYHIFFWTLNDYRNRNTNAYICKIARILFLLYILQITSGAIIYPTYRIYGRGSSIDSMQEWIEKQDISANRIYFDRDFKVGTFLFELKEHFGAFVFPILIYILFCVNECKKNNLSPSLTHLLFIGLLILFTTFNTFIGLYLTSIKSV